MTKMFCLILDVNKRDDYAMTPLDYAACVGNVECVTELIKHGGGTCITYNSSRPVSLTIGCSENECQESSIAKRS